MRLRHRTYILLITLTVALGLVGLMTVNAVINPFGALPGNAFNMDAHRTGYGTRIGKAEMLAEGNVEVLLLGSSRVHLALDPAWPMFGERQVRNTGLGGTTMSEVDQFFQFAIEQNSLTDAFICIDFVTFSDLRQIHPEFHQSRISDKVQPVDYWAAMTIGDVTTQRSLQSLMGHLKDKPGATNSIGFRESSIAQNVPQRALFKGYIQGFAQDPLRFQQYALSERELDAFRNTVRTALAGNKDGQPMRVKFFMNPLHISHLILIREVPGLWEQFEAWKQSLVQILEEENATDVIELWDFTHVNGRTTESIPEFEDITTRMTWWFENSHITPEFGQDLMHVMWPKEAEGEHLIDGQRWALRLTSENIDQHIDLLKRDVNTYANENINLVDFIQQTAGFTNENDQDLKIDL